MHKRIIAIALSGLMLSGSVALAGCNNAQNSAQSKDSSGFKNADKIEEGAILQAFSWDFNTIKKSLPDIAAAGYTSVQTSPINTCLEGDDGGMELYGDGKWYYHYQPTDFKIGNYQLGTRDEFKALCEEADKYNIKILVDVIANHTTPKLDAISPDLINQGGRRQHRHPVPQGQCQRYQELGRQARVHYIQNGRTPRHQHRTSVIPGLFP